MCSLGGLHKCKVFSFLRINEAAWGRVGGVARNDGWKEWLRARFHSVSECSYARASAVSSRWSFFETGLVRRSIEPPISSALVAKRPAAKTKTKKHAALLSSCSTTLSQKSHPGTAPPMAFATNQCMKKIAIEKKRRGGKTDFLSIENIPSAALQYLE